MPTRLIVAAGTGLWAVALVVTLVVPSLHTGDRSWWPWTCVSGIALGAIAWWYVGRGHDNAAERLTGRPPQGAARQAAAGAGCRQAGSSSKSSRIGGAMRSAVCRSTSTSECAPHPWSRLTTRASEGDHSLAQTPNTDAQRTGHRHEEAAASSTAPGP